MPSGQTQDGGQPRRALLRRGRGATGESLANRWHAAAPRAALSRVQHDLGDVMCLQLVDGARGRDGKGASGEACARPFASGVWLLLRVARVRVF